MKRFKQLSSIVFLLIAFIYPSAIAEAKDIGTRNLVENGLNTKLTEQSAESDTNLAKEETSEELLLANHRNRRRYHHRRRQHRHHRRHYRGTGRYQRSYYRGQYYRRGRWQRVRDAHGRLIYDWRHY
ncbi:MULTISPECIES: hypothetical protein [unclassified Anabaena]|uniref:hypothetical protein n=1 Tax=unclassified Anabaena TaxID=2619674 RepID=UPI000A6E8B0E|nr:MULTISPECIES: hypothetical protein [unclassified Anabaena]